MKKMTVVLLFLVCVSSLQAMPASLSHKRYTPSFGEWALIWFASFFHTNEDDYVLRVLPGNSDGEERITIRIRVFKTELGYWFRYEQWPRMKDRIEDTCKMWNAKGYDIEFPDDFIFDVEFYED